MDEQWIREIVREELEADEKQRLDAVIAAFTKGQIHSLIDQINQAIRDGSTIMVK